MFRSLEVFKQLHLTSDDLTQLDDGQEWWKEGDAVTLGGYMPDENNPNPGLDLAVNETIHDNWTTWDDLPENIRTRLENA